MSNTEILWLLAPLWSNPIKLSLPSSIQITATMEDAEKDVKHKIRKLNVMMRNYLPPQLTAGTVDFHKSQMDKIRAIFEDLILSMEDMCDDFQSEMETARMLES